MHRIAIIAIALALSACSPPEEPARADSFTIETDRLTIRVAGDQAEFERHGAQILTRIDTVDPALIKPGIGLWAEPDDDKPYLPGAPKLVLVGRVVAVEPRSGGY